MKDKFLFCLFDGLRRDIVRQDTMPNLSAFREVGSIFQIQVLLFHLKRAFRFQALSREHFQETLN
ncbi:MAG: hypothetical protein CM15mP62_15920 [Rhodospirillaceae bacterium]|nr:MAG: hypothetical protein CM15mP62_15920 [Rhodospirillaceae bacterium]